jgi:hypothetical protein
MNALKARIYAAISDTLIYRAWIGLFTGQNPYLCMGKSQYIFKILILRE